MKDAELKIEITHENGSDTMNVKLTGSANISLGMIARARRVLTEMENAIYADLAKNEKALK